ncbi:hypothetical protein [Methylococcus sp. EFPC2]|uniref:hypothetical protein n=1 Tax=Methylococcus sp. EFPC2 TaxID=2812648 RepID=UPI0019679540|nr:hypothetical protein [Methylococcus sp. EFPC2]QSA96880.1 hypothetical protein JWZ97_17005 [Methylococcus sp. EFPC2]
MIIALRSQSYRSCLHILVYVLLVSWLASIVSSTCVMPASWRATLVSLSAPAGCPDHGHTLGHEPRPTPDCSFKSCLVHALDPTLGYEESKPQIPVFGLFLLGFIVIPLPAQIRSCLLCRTAGPPAGRHVPLIYRYCVLLN